MDKADLIDRRRKRCLAQLLDDFETRIVPHLPAEATPEVNEFKSTVRRKLRAFAIDATELVQLDQGVAINGAAVELKDRIWPHGRDRTQGATPE